MDILNAVLCLCIGNTVAWLLALYTPSGMYRLIWNVAFGIVGATQCGLAIAWVDPSLHTLWLLILGPPSALLGISLGNRVKRRLMPGAGWAEGEKSGRPLA